jgi:hypothetical protein
MPGGITARTLAPSEEAFDAPLSPPPLDDEPGPATGLSGSYPGGTCTHWSSPAVRTQHGQNGIPAGDPVAGFREYHRAVSRWKPSRPILVVLVVLHIIVTTITLRDLSRRTETEVRGPRLFWRVFTPLQMGNSALYWLVGRRRETESAPTSERS